jgi:alkylation response protein AidB-like acyl-CoA dehydrogenase
MDFTINENQKMIADMIQQFGKQNITPFVREWDDNQFFPVEVFKKLGELGLMGVLVPTEYGGSGFTYTEYVKSYVYFKKLPKLAATIDQLEKEIKKLKEE